MFGAAGAAALTGNDGPFMVEEGASSLLAEPEALDLPARIEMADQIVGGALVFIGYGHLQIAGG